VAAPPLSTRAGPHSPLQGPRTANQSGARGEAPPPPGTSATLEAGERGEDAQGIFWVPNPRHTIPEPRRPPTSRTMLPKTESGLPALFYCHKSLYNSQCTRGPRQEQDKQRSTSPPTRCVHLDICSDEANVSQVPLRVGKNRGLRFAQALSLSPLPTMKGTCCSTHLTQCSG
jgi:hypothetical protein